MSEQIDWSKAPEGCIGVFTPNLSIGSIGFRSFFVITKRYSDYGAQAGCSGQDSEGKEYHVFEKYWDYHEKPASWSGEGLPQVGVDIEVLHELYGWIGARVVGQDGEAAIVRTNDGYAGVFRHQMHPIRTPEQIAADEREAFARTFTFEMGKDPSSPNAMSQARRMYDLGYRKP